MTTAQAVIDALGLRPHPEGGWYAETWRAEGDGRPAGTAIYFLLQAHEQSHWHRVDAAEVWLWHAGAPLALRIAPSAEGPVTRTILGPDLALGQRPQAVVPAHAWQAAAPLGGWALVSCVVTPGFRFEGFALAPPGFDIPAPPQPGDEVLARFEPGARARWFAPMKIGSTPAGADEGAALILAGKKTATSAPPWEEPAFPGALSVLLDGRNRPVAVVETLTVEARTFGSLDPDFARAYGEGDGTLAGFRADTGGYYAQAFADRGLPFGDDTTLVAETFRVKHRLPDPG